MLSIPLEGFGLRSTWCKQYNRTHPHFLCATDQVKLRLLRSPSTCVCVPFLVCMLDLPLEGFGLRSTWCKQFNWTNPHFLCATDQVKLRLLRSPSTCVCVPFLVCMLDLPLEGFGLKSTWCKQFNRTHPHFLCATDQVKLRLLRSPSTCVSISFLACMLSIPLEGFGLKSTWCKQFNRTHPHFLCATDQVKLRLIHSAGELLHTF